MCLLESLAVTKGGALTTAEIAAGFARIASHMETVADELNAIDGQLGDGDLGVTLVRGSRDVMAALDQLTGQSIIAHAATTIHPARTSNEIGDFHIETFRRASSPV